MKFLLVLVVVVVGLWLLLGRKRGGGDTGNTSGNTSGSTPRPPPVERVSMLACAHCQVHLPSSETVSDSQGRVFCGEAHRAAGPR